MNYYPRYPAHYLAKTVHLTMLQDGAYTRLMDWYYTNERPVPHAQRYAIARCQSAAERKAVDEILQEFFEQDGDGWENHRIKEEIAKAAPKIAAAKANGARGGRPRNQNPQETHEKPTGFNSENQLGFSEKPRAKAPQSPISNTTTTLEARTEIPSPEPTDAGRACLLLRQAGCARVNPSHPDLLAALAEGVTPEAIRDTYAEAPGKSNPFAYAIATARSRHADGARQIATGPPITTRPVQLSKTGMAVQALEAMKSENRLGNGRDSDGAAEIGLPRLE